MPQQLVVNEAELRDIIRARQSLIGSLDAKRPRAWEQYGYPDTVTFDMLLSAYTRGGPGQGAVHRILDKCWTGNPRIKTKGSEKETPWEKKLGELLKSINGWAKIRDFDRRNMVGRFAGLILRVADGKQLREPMEKAQRLVDLVPVYENQLQVQAWNSDQTSDDFGKPSMWQYRARPPQATNTQGQPDQWVDVHPSRIQILAEGSVGDFFDGVPLLLAGFNHLVDLEKVSGGSAESFLKNSARSLVIKFDAASNPQAITQNADGSASTRTISQAIEEKTEALNRNIDSSIAVQGGEVTTLQTVMHDPKSAWELAANNFAASVRVPFTIMFGQQTGRLASDEDQDDMNARCQSRRETELTPMLAQLVTRLQACGIVDGGEFEIEWPPLDAPGDTDKADLLGKYTAAMKQAFDAGLTEPLFDANELREVVGFKKRADDGMPMEGDPAGDPAAAPVPAPAPAPAPKPRLAA